MELFDTHCHFETTDESQIAAQLRMAAQAGVTRIMAVGGSKALNDGVAAAARAARFPGAPQIFTALGWDRDQAGTTTLEGRASALPPHGIDYANASAVGEIGLDYHYSPETSQAQMELFAAQLELARDLSLPVVIHTREADDDTLGLLREIPSRGIIHCFTGSPPFCRALLDLGFMISFSGIVTFRAADNVRESAAIVPDDRLLIETDSPFLAPVPMRGKQNEPAFLLHTAKFLASLRSMPLDNFAALTTQNALRTLQRDQPQNHQTIKPKNMV